MLPELPRDSNARNSKIRKVTKPLRHSLAVGLDKAGFSPDEFTVAGILGKALDSMLFLRTKEKNSLVERIKRGARLAYYELLDGIDGEVARVQGLQDKNGPLKDAGADRFGEIIGGIGRAAEAHKRGDTIGEVLAYGAVVLNGLPSWARAAVEIGGGAVSEDGNGVVGKLGTRQGRAMLDTAKAVVPEAQRVLDGVTIFASAKTTIDRVRKIGHTKQEKVTYYESQQAVYRAMMLAGIHALSVIASISTYYLLRQRK